LLFLLVGCSGIDGGIIRSISTLWWGLVATAAAAAAATTTSYKLPIRQYYRLVLTSDGTITEIL
jgi:hypothetical protein